MRIIGGRLKGKTINPPMGYKARPTTDFAREGLFNILDNEYEFDDGVGRVWCVEMARDNAAFIKREAARLGLGNVSVVHANVFDFLDICRERFDIVFADPPYAIDGLDGIPDKVLERGLLHPGGYFILEHGGEHSFTTHPCFVKERSYGRVHFSFFEAPGA